MDRDTVDRGAGTGPILDVADLAITFPTNDGDSVRVVDGISFKVGIERVALVGESGSGKSLTARSVLGLVPAPGKVTAGRLRLGDTDLLSLRPRDWNRIRGSEVGLVLQDPRFALNPMHTVGRQVEEALVLHARLSRSERRDRALAMLEAVGLENPGEVYKLYASELSGGMGQRVMIASMLIARPKLLIADEPTSALDEGLRRQILDLLALLAEQHAMGLMLISHDLQQVVDFADRVLVLYRGRLVDEQKAADLAASPNLYTRTLWNCRPSPATFGTRLPTLQRADIEASL